MTSEERAIAQEKIMYVQDTLYVLGGKWKLPILISMHYGNRRFTDIKNSIPDITSRVLSKELKLLEMNKLVKRTVIDDYPVVIEYALTEYIETVKSLTKELMEWGKNHRQIIKGKHLETIEQ